jgi:hypothetical protein
LLVLPGWPSAEREGSMSDARHLACVMAFIVAPGKQR